MRSRVAVALISVAIYVILVRIGVKRLWVRDDYVTDAARRGTAIDVEWWTPYPLGLAYGINLPAVVVGHIGLASVIEPNADRPSMIGELSLAPLVGVFWFWIVGAARRLMERIRSDGSSKAATRTTVCLSAIVLALILWWGLIHHYSEFVPFHSVRDFKNDIESMNILERGFGLLWAAVAIFWVFHGAPLRTPARLRTAAQFLRRAVGL